MKYVVKIVYKSGIINVCGDVDGLEWSDVCAIKFTDKMVKIVIVFFNPNIYLSGIAPL